MLIITEALHAPNCSSAARPLVRLRDAEYMTRWITAMAAARSCSRGSPPPVAQRRPGMVALRLQARCSVLGAVRPKSTGWFPSRHPDISVCSRTCALGAWILCMAWRCPPLGFSPCSGSVGSRARWEILDTARLSDGVRGRRDGRWLWVLSRLGAMAYVSSLNAERRTLVLTKWCACSAVWVSDEVLTGHPPSQNAERRTQKSRTTSHRIAG